MLGEMVKDVENFQAFYEILIFYPICLSKTLFYLVL